MCNALIHYTYFTLYTINRKPIAQADYPRRMLPFKKVNSQARELLLAALQFKFLVPRIYYEP